MSSTVRKVKGESIGGGRNATASFYPFLVDSFKKSQTNSLQIKNSHVPSTFNLKMDGAIVEILLLTSIDSSIVPLETN